MSTLKGLHLETYLALGRGGHLDTDPVPRFVEREFRRYFECAILACGFARAKCSEWGHDFLIALPDGKTSAMAAGTSTQVPSEAAACLPTGRSTAPMQHRAAETVHRS